MFKNILLGLSALSLASCATPTLETRDQWLSESQRLYPDRDPEQVIRAAEAVLQTAFPNSVTFAHNLEGFSAVRTWFATIIIISVHGRDTFEFKAVRESGGTRATLKIDRKQRDTEGGGSDAAVSFLASYRHYFAALDYSLGKRQDWVTCQQATQKLGVENANIGSTLCGPGILPQMSNPPNVKQEWLVQGSKTNVIPAHSRDSITRR